MNRSFPAMFEKIERILEKQQHQADCARKYREQEMRENKSRISKSELLRDFEKETIPAN